MLGKNKMELINNYVDIFKILFWCKQKVFSSCDLDETLVLEKTLEQTLKLKSSYEQIFDKLNMSDTSFLVLKRDLEYSLKKPTSLGLLAPTNEWIETKKNKIETDLKSALAWL